MVERVSLILTPSELPFVDARYLRFGTLPLSLAVLQSFLKQSGFVVHATDLNAVLAHVFHPEKAKDWLVLYDKSRILNSLLENTPTGLESTLDGLLAQTDVASSGMVGISTGANMSFFEIHLAFLLGARIQHLLGIPIVFGGANMDYLWQFRREFDPLWHAILQRFPYVFLGPGERSFAALASHTDTNDRLHCYQQLPGAVYLRSGAIQRNREDRPTFARPDFSGLHLPFYSLCSQSGESADQIHPQNLVQLYKAPVALELSLSQRYRDILPKVAQRETLIIPYYFNHSCTYHCAFCVQSRPEKPPLSQKPAGEVFADLKYLKEHYGSPFFRFYNNAFNLSISFATDLCELIIQKGLEIYWSDCGRFSHLTEDLVALLARAGCRKLVFGLDTASSRLLTFIHKQLDTAHAEQVLSWCRQHGIWAEVEIIVGLPSESQDDFQATYEFLQRNLDRGYLNGFHVNRYFVIPSSLFGSKPEDYGIQLHADPEGYEHTLQRCADIHCALTDPDMARTRSIPGPYRIWHYSEVGGRSMEQIVKETEGRYMQLMALAAKVPKDVQPFGSRERR